jgi:hypothetical protein
MEIKRSSNKCFGIFFFIVFLLVAIWPIFNNESYRLWAVLISTSFLILGIFNSKLLTPLNILWFKFGLFLGKIVSPFVMGIIFFAVVTPIGVFMRILKKDLLNLKKNHSDSYWIIKKGKNSKMKNQF